MQQPLDRLVHYRVSFQLPVVAALEAKLEKMFDFLQGQGAKVPLYSAIEAKRCGMLESLIKDKAEMTAKDMRAATNIADLKTSLHVVKLLLDRGAQPSEEM